MPNPGAAVVLRAIETCDFGPTFLPRRERGIMILEFTETAAECDLLFCGEILPWKKEQVILEQLPADEFRRWQRWRSGNVETKNFCADRSAKRPDFDIVHSPHPF